MTSRERPRSSEDTAQARGGEDRDSDFEFSRLMVSGDVPFEPSQARVERTWQRIARGSAQPQSRPSKGEAVRWLGPIVALSASAATFVAGVWVGSERSAAPGRAVSAEPMERAIDQAHRIPSLGVITELAHAEASGSDHQPKTLRETSAVAERSDDSEGAPAPVSSLRRRGGPSPAPFGIAPPVAPSADAQVNVESPPAASVEVSSQPLWQRLASGGDYEAALVEITQAGGFERVLGPASAEQLMLLSDVARATGQQQRALAALRRIVSEHAADPVAPLAALNMGNLLDKMGDGAGATQAFAVYRALSPKGDFAEDALVRQLRSAVSAGKQELARRLVGQYEADFPEGRRADEVARLAEQVPTQADSSDAGAPERSP